MIDAWKKFGIPDRLIAIAWQSKEGVEEFGIVQSRTELLNIMTIDRPRIPEIMFYVWRNRDHITRLCSLFFAIDSKSTFAWKYPESVSPKRMNVLRLTCDWGPTDEIDFQ